MRRANACYIDPAARYRRERVVMRLGVMRLVVVVCIAMAVVSIWTYSWYGPADASRAPRLIIAYYQTDGANPLAVRTVLALFHRVYPWARVRVYLDTLTTSIRHLPLAPHDLVTLASRTPDGSVSKRGMHYATVHAATAYIERLQSTAALVPDGWVFLLEDDVWVWRAVPEEDLLYDISGTCWARYRPEYAAVLQNRTGSTSVCYGGYGGHFVNSSRLLGLSSDRVRSLVTLLLAAHSPIASDELLSAVVLRDGGTIGYYPGYYEKLHGSGPIRTEHQMKWLYGW